MVETQSILFSNGQVLTVDPAFSIAEAVRVQHADSLDVFFSKVTVKQEPDEKTTDERVKKAESLLREATELLEGLTQERAYYNRTYERAEPPAK